MYFNMQRTFLFQCFMLGFVLHYGNTKAMYGNLVRKAEVNEYPHVVCILKYNPGAQWEDNILCTGTLISDSHVITAEHCLQIIDSEKVEISVGNHVLQEGERHYPMWWISYDHWTMNVGVERHSGFNDILILKLLGLPLRVGYARTSYIYPSSLLRGASLSVVGCGKISTGQYATELRTASVKIVERRVCEQRIKNLRGWPIQLHDKFLCTNNEPYVVLDNVDIGGPLFYQGLMIGISTAVCPELGRQPHPEQVNIHLSFHLYQDFVNSVLGS